MSSEIFSNFNSLMALGAFGIMIMVVTIILVIWSIVWKGYALWISAQEKNKVWFIILFLINTIGILEIIYIFLVSKKGKECIEKWKAKKALSKNINSSEVKEEVIINDLSSIDEKPQADIPKAQEER
jgi:hypothetical protein